MNYCLKIEITPDLGNRICSQLSFSFMTFLQRGQITPGHLFKSLFEMYGFFTGSGFIMKVS